MEKFPVSYVSVIPIVIKGVSAVSVLSLIILMSWLYHDLMKHHCLQHLPVF